MKEYRIQSVAAGSFTALLAVATAYVHLLFAPIVPTGRLWSWSGAMAFVIVLMVALPLAGSMRKPPVRNARFLAHAGRTAAILFSLVVAASVWLLLPFASEDLRLLMVAFYAAAVAGQMIVLAGSLATVSFGAFSVFGSTAAFFFLAPGRYSTPLALFLLAFAAILLGLAVAVRRASRSAALARLDAEAASRERAAALDRAAEAQAAKVRFIAAATHDLRQPLQAAALFFEQFTRSAGGEAGADAAEGARLAFRETNVLLDQILNHLRLDAGEVEPKLEVAAVQMLLARVAQDTAPLARANGIVIRWVATSRHVVADPDMVVRILRNFVQNALRHSQGRRILVGCRSRADTVRIYVTDNGTGIPAEERPLLFIEYARGSRQRGDGGGMGLGLAAARRLAELMGARAGFDPRWPNGAAFFLELSRSEPSSRHGGALARPNG